MGYVIVCDNIVRLGPMIWKPNYFQNFIEDHLSTSCDIPFSNPEESVYVVSDRIKILPIKNTEFPYFNNSTHDIANITYDLFDNYAVPTYNIKERDIGEVRQQAIDRIRTERYNREHTEFKINVHDREVWVDPSRDERLKYSNGVAGYWKFKGSTGETWILLAEEDLVNISNQIKQHVQSCFDWEISQILKVNQINTINDLAAYNPANN